jgi:hypothetical protein
MIIPKQCQEIGLYNGDGLCSQSGTHWSFAKCREINRQSQQKILFLEI